MAGTDEDLVKDILSGYERDFLEVFHGAWEDRCELSRRGCREFRYDRVPANIVHDYIVQRALDKFGNDPNIEITERDKTVKLQIKGKVQLRFKKAGVSGVGSNVRTQANTNFITNRQIDIPGPGFFLPRKVEMVYVLNSSKTRMEEVLVVARNGRVRLWSYAIEGHLSSHASSWAQAPTQSASTHEVTRLRADTNRRRVDKK